MTLTFSSMNFRDIFASASVIGQSHLETAIPNQDAFIIKEYAFGTVLVVADGLGSKKHSEIGSKAVCQAVCESARLWARKDDVSSTLLIRLIHSIWELKIHPYDKSECGTTCLFALVLKNGKVILGQLGDGLVCYKTNKEFFVLNDKEEEFSNLTKSISHVRSSSEWHVEIHDVADDNLILFLATDGVSEDLIKEKRSEYLVYLRDKIFELPNQRTRNLEIENILNNWITKHSLDDKTMIVFTREVEHNAG